MLCIKRPEFVQWCWCWMERVLRRQEPWVLGASALCSCVMKKNKWKNTFNGESNTTDASHWFLGIKVYKGLHKGMNCAWNTGVSWLRMEAMALFLWSSAHPLLWVTLKRKRNRFTTYRKSVTALSPYSSQIHTDLHLQGWLILRCQGSRIPSLSQQVTNFRSSRREQNQKFSPLLHRPCSPY